MGLFKQANLILPQHQGSSHPLDTTNLPQDRVVTLVPSATPIYSYIACEVLQPGLWVYVTNKRKSISPVHCQVFGYPHNLMAESLPLEWVMRWLEQFGSRTNTAISSDRNRALSEQEGYDFTPTSVGWW